MSAETLFFEAYEAYLPIVTTAAGTNATVYDGPQPVLPTKQSFIIVGCDDPRAVSPVTAINGGTQVWDSVGAPQREEHFRIWSSLVVWGGDPSDFASLRATAKTVIKAIGDALRPAPIGTGDGMLGNVLGQYGTGWCGLVVDRLQQGSDGNGANIHCVFALDCVAYL